MQQPNVNIIRAPIERICDKGIRTADGVLHELDVLICATGFNTSFSARYHIIGQDKKKALHALWTDQPPEAYMGLAISGYPNHFSKWRRFSSRSPRSAVLTSCSIPWTKLSDSQRLPDTVCRSQVSSPLIREPAGVFCFGHQAEAHSAQSISAKSLRRCSKTRSRR